MVKRVPIETYCEKKIFTLQKNAIGMIDYIDISSVDNIKKKIISFQTMNAKDAPSRAKQLLKKYDILVSTVRPNLNAVAVVESETDNLMVGSTGYCVLRCKDNMDFRYLFNFCQSQYFIDDMSSQATGASYPAVSTAIVRSSLIPNYPVDEQRRIASELDKITDLIDKRKEQLEKLDALVKARFVELFGDPVCNSKKLILSPLNDVCTKITDGTHDTPARYNSGYLLITGKNIRSSGIIFDDVEFVSEEDHKIIYSRCNPEYGDVLYTNIGVNYGTACYNNLDYEFSMKNVALLKPNQRLVNGYYLWECLNIMRNHILAMNQVGGAQTFMGLATIKKITIPVPQIELQEQFASFVEQTDKSKLEVQKSLEKLELLKKALMQKYFG